MGAARRTAHLATTTQGEWRCRRNSRQRPSDVEHSNLSLLLLASASSQARAHRDTQQQHRQARARARLSRATTSAMTTCTRTLLRVRQSMKLLLATGDQAVSCTQKWVPLACLHRPS